MRGLLNADGNVVLVCCYTLAADIRQLAGRQETDREQDGLIDRQRVERIADRLQMGNRQTEHIKHIQTTECRQIANKQTDNIQRADRVKTGSIQHIQDVHITDSRQSDRQTDSMQASDRLQTNSKQADRKPTDRQPTYCRQSKEQADRVDLYTADRRIQDSIQTDAYRQPKECRADRFLIKRLNHKLEIIQLKDFSA